MCWFYWATSLHIFLSKKKSFSFLIINKRVTHSEINKNHTFMSGIVLTKPASQNPVSQQKSSEKNVLE